MQPKRTFAVSAIAVIALLCLDTHTAVADIMGGEDVKPGDPVSKSTVALYEPQANGQGGALCTASLIGSNTAVTAAHCVDPRGPKPVLIFGKNVRAPGADVHKVTQVAVNPKWKTHQGIGMDQGDIALVKFQGEIPDGYRTVPMATPQTRLRKGEKAVLAGYGISDAQRKTGAGVLRKTKVTVENPRPGKSEMILDQSHGHGACHGDSGGPAFVHDGRRVVLAGVTNRSYPDSAPDDCRHKVVYTKVASYQPWIEKTESRFARGSSSKQSSAGHPSAEDQPYSAHSSATRTMRSIKRKIQYRLPKRSGPRTTALANAGHDGKLTRMRHAKHATTARLKRTRSSLATHKREMRTKHAKRAHVARRKARRRTVASSMHHTHKRKHS